MGYLFSMMFSYYLAFPVAACVGRAVSVRVFWRKIADANLLNKPLSMVLWYLVSLCLTLVVVWIPIGFSMLVAPLLPSVSGRAAALVLFNLPGLLPLAVWLVTEHVIASKSTDKMVVRRFWNSMLRVGMLVVIELAVALLAAVGVVYSGAYKN